MQSQLYYLRWGKPLLVRPFGLGPNVCKTFESHYHCSQRKSLCSRPNRPPDQKRQSTTWSSLAAEEDPDEGDAKASAWSLLAAKGNTREEDVNIAAWPPRTVREGLRQEDFKIKTWSPLAFAGSHQQEDVKRKFGSPLANGDNLQQERVTRTTWSPLAMGEHRYREDAKRTTRSPRASGEEPPLDNFRAKRAPRKELIASQRSRQGVLTPPKILAEYLDIKDASERQKFVTRIRAHLKPSRLPSILLYYLHATSLSDASSPNFDKSFVQAATKNLSGRGMTVHDMAHWEWILSADGPDGMIDRFFATKTRKPQFLLLEILRRDIQQVESLNKILVYMFSEQNVVSQKRGTGQLTTGIQLPPGAEQHDNSFGVLISHLLRQARRIWPSAVVSIAHLTELHFSLAMDGKKNSTPEEKLHKVTQLSEFFNYIIGLLSLPAKANPLASVRHNWKAQKVMLELAGKFDPPLMLSQSSYRSIVRTLAATRKSDVESRSAMLRTRSWPPWRQDEDGMDASRLLEEDFSRVISAMSKSQEAGFRQNDWDDAMGVYGGVEPDGTPSIQTRRALRKPRDLLNKGSMSSRVWAARVEATRDVQEAWGAFLEFRTRDGIPQQDMFMAMFEKINYHSAVAGRKNAYTAPPGDGKEVLPVSNDNYTAYYIERFRPPTLSVLYREMSDMGIRPSGRCLNFLIRKARTTDEGLRFILDAGIDQMAVRFLAEGSSSMESPTVLQKIPDGVLYAYIDLTCRLAARAVIEQTDWKSLPKHPYIAPRFTFLETQELRAGEERVPTTWTVLEQRPTNPRHYRTRETFNHVAFLIMKSSTTFRPTWYAYFRALAKEGAVISREVVGNPKWDSLAWLRISKALQDFEALGLELEPEGFHHICVCFEKFAGPLGKLTKKYEGTAPEQAQIVRAAFAKLSRSQQESDYLPGLFHNIRGVHLHAYIRALGAVNDHEGIMSALEWMVKHNEQLEAIAQENRNGISSFRKTLVAIKYLLGRSDDVESAREMAAKVTWWGSWPTNDAVLSYLKASRDDLRDEKVQENFGEVEEDLEEDPEEDFEDYR